MSQQPPFDRGPEGDIVFQVPIGDHKAELTWQRTPRVMARWVARTSRSKR